MTDQLSTIIDNAWDARDGISSATQGEVRDAVNTALAGLDDGRFRVAEKLDGQWQVNQWLKKAVLLSFRLNDNVVVDGGASGAPAYDKVPSKFAGWGENRFRDAGFRTGFIMAFFTAPSRRGGRVRCSSRSISASDLCRFGMRMSDIYFARARK